MDLTDVIKGTEWSLSEDRTTVTFTYRFEPWDFDRAGLVPVWTLSDRAAWLVFLGGTVALPKEIWSDLRFFTRCQVWDIHPSFYSRVTDEQLPGSSLKVRARMAYLGETSMIKAGDIIDDSTNQVLVNGLIQDVNINLDTRRPKAFPDWFKTHYPHLTSQPRPATVEAFEKPSSVKSFTFTVTVLPSDIDGNNHTNQRHYIRYCFNCAALGAKQGAYSTVKGDLFKQGVRKVSVLYQKESLEGDVLTIESWEESPGTLRLQVRKGEDNLVQVTFQFHVPSISEAQHSKL